jgi:hypothetical protein
MSQIALKPEEKGRPDKRCPDKVSNRRGFLLHVERAVVIASKLPKTTRPPIVRFNRLLITTEVSDERPQDIRSITDARGAHSLLQAIAASMTVKRRGIGDCRKRQKKERI